MKTFLKYSGVLLILVGVLVLALPYLLRMQTNGSLLVGWLLTVVGFVWFIIVNRRL